ncbi:unnamed protein product [Closterium sp. Naga37s-1]|nr:unnamed protein product [Closterium sp. Naga37s-1]
MGLDKEEMQKEYNVREFYPPPAHVDSFTVRSHHLPGGEITVQPLPPLHLHVLPGYKLHLAHCVLRLPPLVRAAALPPLALPGPLVPLQRAPGESGRPLPAVVSDSLVAALLEGVMEEHRLMLLYMNTLLLTKENALPAILEPVSTDAGGQVEGEKQQQQQQQGEEEWRMWEEVDSWHMAAGNAWPAVEAHDSPLQMGAGKGRGRVQGEVSEECCEGMMRAIKDAGKGQKGRTGAWYLAHVDALAAAAAAGAAADTAAADAAAATAAAAAAPGEGHGGKGGQRGCVSAQCGKVEGAGVQLKLCSRCGKAAYCSRECQKAHWPTHKLTCLPKAKGKEKVEE